MDETRTRALLELHEGRRHRAYLDTLGNSTIGIGHLIRPDERHLLTATLTDAEVEELFQSDFLAAHSDLTRSFPWFSTMSDVRQAVLIDMRFNLGLKGLKGFHGMLSALVRHNYTEASKHMLGSKWRRQVGNRARTLAAMMTTSRWPAPIQSK